MDNIIDFDDGSDRTWEMAMADTTPSTYPVLTGKLFWLMLGTYTQPAAKAVA
jgi:hypothetical protein